MDLKFSILFLSFLVSLNLVGGINVLIICPTPSYSHQVPFIAIGTDLVRRGHTVTIITTDPLKKALTNYTEIDISDSYKYFKPQPVKTAELSGAIDYQKRKAGYEFIADIEKTTNAYTEDQLKSKSMQKFLKEIDENSIKFDLIIYEGLLHSAYLGFVPKLGYPPLITMQTLNPTCLFGIHCDIMICNPSYIPEILSGYTLRMSLLQRMDNLYMYLYTSYIVRPRIMNKQDLLMEKYFRTSGLSGQQLEENKTLLFLSTSWLMTYPRPIFPNMILLGPLHLSKPKPLPQDLKSWIEGAKEGVIYFSLGSNMLSASLKEDKRRAIIDSFNQFPHHRVIWKWEEEPLPGLPSNVICRKWLPQHDLLAHPSVKLFIMQGGLQSSQEAVHFQVPIIGIPFFADQDYNVKKLESVGIARYLEYEDISAETLTSLMKSILYNKTVYEKIQLYSKLSSAQMMSPIDTAYWWIQYVLTANGNVDHLRVNLSQIPLYQYYFIDAILLLLLATLVILFVIFKIAMFALGFYKNIKKQKTT